MPELTQSLFQDIPSKFSIRNKVIKDKNIFICGINPKITFVILAVFGNIITNPKSKEPKLKNFTAVVPVFVDWIMVVKKTHAAKIEKENKPIVRNNKN